MTWFLQEHRPHGLNMGLTWAQHKRIVGSNFCSESGDIIGCLSFCLGVSLSVSVCVCLCLSVCMCVYVYIYICVCMYVFLHIYACVQVDTGTATNEKLTLGVSRVSPSFAASDWCSINLKARLRAERRCPDLSQRIWLANQQLRQHRLNHTTWPQKMDGVPFRQPIFDQRPRCA